MDFDMIGGILSEFVKGVLIVDSHQVIAWSNDIYKELYEGVEIVGKSFSEVFSLQLEEIGESGHKLENLSGKKYVMRQKFLPGDKRGYVLVYIEEITDFNNKDTRIYCLENIIDNINEGVLISDYEGRFVLYNKSQEKLEGLSSKEVIGKYLWEGYRSSPELSEHRNVYRTNTPIIDRYSAHAYMDGIPKYVSYSTFPIIKDGETVAVYSISRNENRLQSLLHETLELKRKLYSTYGGVDTKYHNNGTRYTFSDIMGESSVLTSLIKDAETIALLSSPVLIIGETGTGKEVFAQSIHNYGRNKGEPFVDINCSAIPENLLESILFGTVKGSYTGAADQAGLFEEARGGTLFLDEINSMPVAMQAKLLRVLQERKVRRVGSLESVPINCRIISAVNEDPEKAVKEGKMRQDLYYRLAGVSLYLPPLRERTSDIVPTILFFVGKYNKLLNKNVKSLSGELCEVVMDYSWPGNIRELEHMVENIMIRTADDQEEIHVSDIPPYMRRNLLGSISKEHMEKKTESLPGLLRDMEKKMILESLKKNRWNLTHAAGELGIIRQSLEYRMKKLGIKRPDEI